MRNPDAWQLRAAAVAMTARYGEAVQQFAYAIPGPGKERHNAAARRRFVAVQRLTGALARMADDGGESGE